MKCVICRQGETHPGNATVILTREGMTLVVKRVPANVCDNCGEEYLEEDVTADLLSLVERSAQTGVEVEILEYAGAAGGA
jgi:YgiT-type zinc finger domain-containing protein